MSVNRIGNMRRAPRREQRGLTLISFIIVMSVLGFSAYIVMKLFPMYSEFYSVKSALKGLASEPGIANASPARIQDLFFRRLNVDYSDSVKKDNVKIERDGEGWLMKVSYEVRTPLVFNLDVVGKFDTSQTLTRSGDGI
jgi:hypothetical protein